MEQFFLEQDGVLNERRPGVSICFADPDQSALDACVFWTPEDYQRTILAHVCNHVESDPENVISLGKFCCQTILLKTVGGEQHLLLANRGHVAQVRCIGDDIRVTPFALQPVIKGFPNVEHSQRLIRVLADLYRNRSFSGANTDWTVEGLRHRDALAAFDKRSQGCSYREIAIFLHDKIDVETDWNNPGQILKNRVIRGVKRGQRMVSGGYKTLLK